MVMLDRKLLRDLLAWRGQLAAIALIVACGVATYVAMQSVYRSLYETRKSYYDTYRFSHVFSSLTRAPESVAERLAAVDGVTSVQTRVVADVTIDLPDRDDAVTARLISLPESRRPNLNDVYLRSGRYIRPDAPQEALASEAFADANGLRIGSRVGAIINRRRQTFRIVGIALSPEYVYEIRGASDIWPDNRHFGILWVGRKTLAAAFDLTGAFNDVALSLGPRANEDAVIERVDRLLARFGSVGAVPARLQASNLFLSDELVQLRVQAIFIPLIFLGIASFLLNVACSRLIGSQREQIAILKALGFSTTSVAFHYAKAVAVVMGVGAALGTALGSWLGWRLTIIYTHFFHFPAFRYRLDPSVVAAAVAIVFAASLVGALSAIARTVSLPPAEAMRPPAPMAFRRTLVERLGITRWLAPATQMMLRNLERKPFVSAATALAIAFAAAILVVGRFGLDAVQYMVDVQFRTIQREDVTVTFVRPLSSRVRMDLAALPGVREIEPYRMVLARLSSGHRHRRVAILGIPAPSRLYHIVDAKLRTFEAPSSGVLLNLRLARLLHIGPGDRVDVTVLEGRPIHRSLPVRGVVDDLIGLNAYMRDDALHRMLDEDQTISGAYLTIDPQRTKLFDRSIKNTPAVTGVAYRESMMLQFERTISESMGISIAFLIGFASAIACGVVYNAGRIALSERSRELATLRILGFTRTEVATLLLGEQAIVTAVAIPVGCVLGYALSLLLGPLYETEVYTTPIVVSGSTYGFASTVVAMAAVVSGWLVRRQLDRLDLIAVLKAGE